MVIAKDLNGELTREEAINELGADVVHRVDQANDTIDEHVKWSLDDPRARAMAGPVVVDAGPLP